ncbi:chloride channel protein [Opitutaceae bacterium TAV4]|nr:chloride channel protein [Opitutaceae bacterium TAV4]RRK01758.1 chloride channel protein [Opitutaceae bacterium TAV3]
MSRFGSFASFFRRPLESAGGLRARVKGRGKGFEAAVVGVLGVVVGFVAVGFHAFVEFLHHWAIVALREHGVWVFVSGSFASVVAASLIATALVRGFAKETAGGGILPTKLAFWRDFGFIRARTGVVKFFASAITLGGGVSMGPEGPVAQIGASVMSTGAGWLGVPKQKRRLYCAGGVAAAIAAVFNAPLAAIAFVLEEIVGDLSSRLIGGILLAAVVGALMAHALIGPQPAFQVQALSDPTWRGLLLVPLVGVLAAVGGVAGFQKGTLATRGWVRSLPRSGVPEWAIPTAGALGTWVLGGVAFWLTGRTGVFGIGYEDVTAAISGELVWSAALVLLLAKLGATFLAVGSGGCGGIFAPSFFIGAMAGALVAALGGLVLPLTGSDKAMLVMAGMSAGFMAVIRTPVTAILLIFEVTHQFVVMPFLLLATLVSYVVSNRLEREGLYEGMMRQDGEDPNRVLPPRDFRRWREMPVGALATYRAVIATDLSGEGLADLLARNRYNRFPVVDGEGAVMGVLSRSAAVLALATKQPPKLEPAVWVDGATPLGRVQERLLESPSNFLCLGDESQRRLAGVFTLHDLLRGQETLVEVEG